MRLFICALWSPAGKGLTSWLSFVMSNCEFVTFPLVQIFSRFPYISICKIVNPGRGYFWPKEHYLNKLGRGILGDATYQILRHYTLWFKTKSVFHVIPISLYK